MPRESVKAKAERDLRQGKSRSTAAGEFVRDEIERIRRGEHGARNPRQAIAIGLSEARRAGIAPEPGPSASARTRKKAAQDTRRAGKPVNRKRSAATKRALEREPTSTVSSSALSAQGKRAAQRRRKAGGSTTPRASAKKAATTRKRTTSKRKTARRTSAH